MRTARRRRARVGLTLIELVVAITITGVALATGYGALSWMAGARRAADRTANEAARAAAVRRALTAWVGGARLTPEGTAEFRGVHGVRSGPGAVGPARDGVGEAGDELVVLTTAATPLDAGETVVRLYVDRDSTTPARGLVAEFRVLHGTRVRQLEIEPRVTALDARFLTGVAGAEQWLPSWISTSVLPKAVELRLSAAPGDTLAPLLRLPIRVAFPGGL